MADLEIVLENIVLYTQPVKGEWCLIFLKCNNEIIKLGEEDRSIFLERLTVLFNYDLAEINGQIENLDVTWIASLAESHCAIYAGIKNDNLCIFFVSQSGEIIERVELSRIEAKRRLEQLKALIKK